MAEETRSEFKCWEDDAWYHVELELKDSILTVIYPEFPDYKEYYGVEAFQTVEEVRKRFRLYSPQLQDSQCKHVKSGTRVCACCTTDGKDLKYFDGVLKKIHRSAHSFAEDEEICSCKFGVFWLAGPNVHKTTYVFCKDICLLNKGVMESHPILNNFLSLVTEQMSNRASPAGKLINGSSNVKGQNWKKSENSHEQLLKWGNQEFSNIKLLKKKAASDDQSIVNPKEQESNSTNSGYPSSYGVEKKYAHVEINYKESSLTSSVVSIDEWGGSSEDLNSPGKKLGSDAKQDTIEATKRFDLDTMNQLEGFHQINHSCRHEEITKNISSYSKTPEDMTSSERDGTSELHSMHKKTCEDLEPSVEDSDVINSRTKRSEVESRLVSNDVLSLEMINKDTVLKDEKDYHLKSSRAKWQKVLCDAHRSMTKQDQNANNKDQKKFPSVSHKESDSITQAQMDKSANRIAPNCFSHPVDYFGNKDTPRRISFETPLASPYEAYNFFKNQPLKYSDDIGKVINGNGSHVNLRHGKALVLDNLDADLAKYDIIYGMSMVISVCQLKQVYILPPLKFEKFKTAILLFDNDLSLDKAYTSLEEERYFIVSSSGRPWVASYSKELIYHGKFEGFTSDIQDYIESQKREHNTKVRIIVKESPEYGRVKKMKSAYIEFRKRYSSLKKRLEIDELHFLSEVAI